MALIRCPDCGRDVSDAAPACIGCGRPIVPSAPAATPTSQDVWHAQFADGRVSSGTLAQLDDAYQAGHINGATLVRREGTKEWVTLARAAGMPAEPEPSPRGREAVAADPVAQRVQAQLAQQPTGTRSNGTSAVFSPIVAIPALIALGAVVMIAKMTCTPTVTSEDSARNAPLSQQWAAAAEQRPPPSPVPMDPPPSPAWPDDHVDAAIDPCAATTADTLDTWAADRDDAVCIRRMRGWPVECREWLLAQRCADFSCDYDVAAMVLKAASGKEAVDLRKAYGGRANTSKAADDARRAQVARDEKAAVAADRAAEAARIADLDRQEKEQDRLAAENKRRIEEIERRCSGKTIMNTCCDRACNSGTSIEDCLRSFYRQGCSNALGMAITCSCQ